MQFSTRVVSFVLGVVAWNGSGCDGFSSATVPTFVTSRSSSSSKSLAFGRVTLPTTTTTTTTSLSFRQASECPNRRLHESQLHHTKWCDCLPCRKGRLTTLLHMSAEDNEEDEEDTEEEGKAVAQAGEEEEEGESDGDSKPRRVLNRTDRENVALEDLVVGSTVEGTVRSVVSYGAFVDVGAETDSLLHVSAMSDDFVSNPQDVVTVGDKVQVRILSVDAPAKKISVSMKSETGASSSRPQRSARQRGPSREAQTAVLQALEEAGIDEEKFVSAEVISTVDFGAFVLLSAGDLVEGVEGQVQGLVHISALCQGRVDTVESLVKVGDTVQVRVVNLEAAEGKIGLSMVGGEGNPTAPERQGGGGRFRGGDDDDSDNVSVSRGGGGGIATFDARDYEHLGFTDAINEGDLAYNQEDDENVLSGIELSAEKDDDDEFDLWGNPQLRAELDEIAARNLLDYDKMENDGFLDNYVDDYDAPDLSNARPEDFGGIWTINDKREWVGMLAEWNESQPKMELQPTPQERKWVDKKKTWEDKLAKMELEATKKRNRNRRRKRDGPVETPTAK